MSNMSYKKYTIANINITVSGISYLKNNWINFQNSIIAPELPSFEIHILEENMGRYFIQKYNINNKNICFRYNSEILFTDQHWNKCVLLPPIANEDLSVVMTMAFYANAVRNHMIQMHSSLVKYMDKGIMFLGPSGIGKTTQAELWNKYLDALIINGDIVYVEDNGNEFIGWGTPWHGSSPYCENTSIPIKALIVLKQGNVNKIRKLEGLEMLSEVEKQLFYPEWVDNGIELALDVLDHLLRNVPVYELINKANRESVELVKQVIFIDEKN